MIIAVTVIAQGPGYAPPSAVIDAPTRKSFEAIHSDGDILPRSLRFISITVSTKT